MIRHQLYTLPDGRHVAVGTHASIPALDLAGADVEPHEHAVVLEQSALGEHHAKVEQELRDALKRVERLDGALHAVRSWMRGRLESLDSAQRDWRQSGQNAAKIALLNDLTRVLDHLGTRPPKNGETPE